MKQSHDSSDDYKFAVTANKMVSEKTAIFICSYYYFLNSIVLCNDNTVIIVYAYVC